MIVKIHLKTLCGCTRTLFQRMDKPTYYFIAPVCTWEARRFEYMHAVWKSKYRVEVWYEECYD